MKYKAEAVYNERDFIAFMQSITRRDAGLRAMNKVGFYVTKGGGTVLEAAGAINLITGLLSGSLDLTVVLISLAMMFGGAFLLFLRLDELPGKKLWKQYVGQGANIGYEFYDEYFTEVIQGNVRERDYGKITALDEDEGHFFLYFSEQSADIVRKDSFKTGDPETFGAFIAEKTPQLLESEEEENQSQEGE